MNKNWLTFLSRAPAAATASSSSWPGQGDGSHGSTEEGEVRVGGALGGAGGALGGISSSSLFVVVLLLCLLDCAGFFC